jgi:PAS domain S-box-containing protein
MKKIWHSENYLRDFFDHAPIGFHSFGPDQIIVDINQAELDMLGYTKPEVVGKKTWKDLIVPDEIPLFEKHWKMINRKGQVKNLKYTVRRKDGRQRKVLLNASARFDAQGRLKHTRGSVVDITDLEHVENMQTNIEQTIFPLVEKLKRRGSSLDKRHLILLEKHLQDLTEGFSLKLMKGKWRLSAREIEICKMLKNGFKTKDIADLLSTSMRTVEHHRNHIRKKLNITSPAVDLGNYLKKFAI